MSAAGQNAESGSHSSSSSCSPFPSLLHESGPVTHSLSLPGVCWVPRSYFKKYNYQIKETGDVITFEGVYAADRGQAAAVTFYTFAGAIGARHSRLRRGS